MPAPFTQEQIRKLRAKLWDLYVIQNKSLREMAEICEMSEAGIYYWFGKLKIPMAPWRKKKFLNYKEVTIPSYSKELAEFIGIMLGDGRISPTQIWVTSHAIDDFEYHEYIKKLIKDLFGCTPKSYRSPEDHTIECYLGSVRIVRFLKTMGLVENKVKYQVAIPGWIFSKPEYQRACLRGLIDTDGSVYKLKFGIQISFTNHSKPLIEGTRELLIKNRFHPSKISSDTVYLTRRKDLERYFKEIGTSNPKHLRRYLSFNGRFA